MKKVLFFGIYDPDYSRNRILIRGFKENGWEVTQCRVNPRIHKGIGKYALLIRERAHLKHFDVQNTLIFVAFPGQTVMLLARILFPRSKIIFDAFTSVYDSNVFDRKLYGP